MQKNVWSPNERFGQSLITNKDFGASNHTQT